MAAPRRRAPRRRRWAVSGTVADVGSGALTVTEPNGTTVTVKTSSSTTVTTLETISVSDLAVGQSVMVRGTTTNGTVTATAIETGALAGARAHPAPRAQPHGRAAIGQQS